MSLLLAAALLTATDGGLDLEWVAPPVCPGDGSVRARLSGVTGTVRAEVTPSAAGFEVRIDVDGSTRTLSTTTCEEAADAAILIIRLAFNPGETKPAAAVELANPELAAPIDPPRKALTWGFHAAALAATHVFWLPRPLFLFGGSLSVRLGPVAILVDAVTSLSLRFTAGPTPDAAVEVRVPFALDAGLCWLFESGRFRGGPCLTGGAAWLTARGMNVTDPRQSSALLWSVVPSGRISLNVVGPLELVARAGLRLGAAPAVSFGAGAPVVQGSWVDLLVNVGAGASF